MKTQTFRKRLLCIVSISLLMSLLFGAFCVFPGAAAAEVHQAMDDYVVLDANYIFENLEKEPQVSVGKASWNHIAYELKNEGFEYVRMNVLSKDGKKHNDPYIGLYLNGEYSADVYKYVTIVVKSDENAAAGISKGGKNFQLFFDTNNSPGFAEPKSAHDTYAALEGYQVLTYDFSQNSKWGGDISRLRLDIYSHGEFGDGDYCDIAAIILNKTPEAVYDSAFEVLCDIYSPEQVISDFTEDEIGCLSSKEIPHTDTKVSITDGNIRFDAAPDYNDPYVPFYYKTLMDARGVAESDRLTTEDFDHTVIRYRTSPQISSHNMQLFIFAGEHYVPFKVGNSHLSPGVSYSVSQNNNWRSMAIHMDGVPSTAAGWSGDFNGFRIDWCGNTGYGEYMEIADFLFFANGNDANAFSAALNTLELAIPERSALHDGSYFAPITSGANYTTIWAEELNGLIVDNEIATHKFNNAHGVPFVRLAVLQKSDNPYIELNIDPQNADEYKFVNLLIRTDITTNPAFALCFADENGEYSDERVGISRYSSSTDWQVITLNFTELSSWSGEITKLKLDFLCGGPYYSVGTGCDLIGISFCRDAEAVYDSAYEMSVKAYNPVQVLDNFSESDITYFQNKDTEGNTAITTANGNLIYTATGTGDPQKTFNYESYANAHGLKAVTTDVFQYTVMRYRSQGLSSSQMNIELYYLTGDAKGLWDMAGYNYTDENGKLHYSIHRTNAGYQATTTWKTTVFNMAKTDGMAGADKLLNGWHREDGNTRFQGFRFDWCASANIGASFELSDIVFFVDEASASAFSATVNSVIIPQSMKDPDTDPNPDDGDLPFDEETTTEIPDIETEDTDLPLYPDGEDTEEEIPTFPNEDDDDIPVEDDSDSDVVDDTETETEPESETGNGEIEDDETEPEEGGPNPPENTESETFPDISGGVNVDDEPENKGSEVPFLVACILLACLSVASIVTVIVIKFKSKKTN